MFHCLPNVIKPKKIYPPTQIFCWTPSNKKFWTAIERRKKFKIMIPSLGFFSSWQCLPYAGLFFFNPFLILYTVPRVCYTEQVKALMENMIWFKTFNTVCNTIFYKTACRILSALFSYKATAHQSFSMSNQ